MKFLNYKYILQLSCKYKFYDTLSNNRKNIEKPDCNKKGKIAFRYLGQISKQLYFSNNWYSKKHDIVLQLKYDREKNYCLSPYQIITEF